jgi:nicastrin
LQLALKKKSGILYQTNTQQDLDNFITETSSGDYAIVIPYSLLTKANLNSLASTNRVTGLIVLLTGADGPLFSPDSTCPNCQFGLYANDTEQYVWNPQAQSLIEQNFDYPIFAIRPEDTISKKVYEYIMKVFAFTDKKIQYCNLIFIFCKSIAYNKQNDYNDYPLKAIDFDLFMWAAVNSETCLRRGWCQVVGGMSVFSSPSLNIAADDKKPIIVVSASIDSRSMFHDLTIGATKDVSGMITVLAIADALSRVNCLFYYYLFDRSSNFFCLFRRLLH